MSRRKSILLGGGLLVVVIAVSWVVIGRSANPTIQGKALNTWIEAFKISDGPPAPAAQALTEAGPRAEPRLANMLRQRDANWSLKIKRWLFDHKWTKRKPPTAGLYQAQAVTVCSWLAQDVQGAAPVLAELVADFPGKTKDRGLIQYALHVLAAMGTNGATAMSGLLSHPDPQIRKRAAQLLGTMSGGEAGLAALNRYTNSNDGELRQAATFATELILKRHEQHLQPVPPGGPSATPPQNVWQVDRGLKVTAASGLIGGEQGERVFGTKSSGPESSCILFSDQRREGDVHFLEWTTPQPVTIQAIGLLASHDGGESSYQRAFREFRFYAWDEQTMGFKPFYIEQNSVPYGRGLFSTCLSRFRNLAMPVTAARFRLELVQSGSTSWSGPRLFAVYGFDQPVTEPVVAAALKNQPQPYQVFLAPELAAIKP